MPELSDALSELRKDKETDSKLGAIADLLARNNIDLEEVGSVSRISIYQQASKDADGDVQVTDLVGVQINPKWSDGPEWPVVQPADPVIIKGATPPKKTKTDFDWKCAVILPDPQIGYRKYEDGELDPFHDEAAMGAALKIAAQLEKTVGVDLVVNLGDFIDMPEHSRYTQEASFAQTTQSAINRGHQFLAEQRATCPHARIILLEGNHDNRLNLHTTNNAKASFGLKRAGSVDKWPVLSVPFLLRLDDLNVEFFDKYPAEQFWINKNLRAIHGDKANSSGSTAAQWANKYPHISTVFGHIHRMEAQYKTVFDSEGPIRSVNVSPGCLCRVDGAVPSTKSGVGADGRPGVHYEDWQQGMAVIWYKETGEFRVELIHILDGVAVYNGVEYSADKE